ncbi:MAG: hypothetical protein GXY03_11860 [Solirubrobacterales bacterium]|nr:hypothetical protein [Solirubrobacterales bacterium]
MANPPSGRSVKIDQDERGGWSSDRPRREGGERPPDVSVRCHVLRPTELLRYSPGSLLLVVAPVAADGERFVTRLIEERGAVLSIGKVRELITGRVPEAELDARAAELLEAAVAKRLGARESVVVPTTALDGETRARFVLAAARQKRPRHLVLIEPPREAIDDDARGELNALRRALESGALGDEGFHTALRLGPATVGDVRRVVFRPPPSDD